MKNKKISPQAVLALKEALIYIYWKKSDLKDFIKLTLTNSSIVATINWDNTKREAVYELVERMINRLDIYQDDLLSLLISVTDFNDFSHLDFWDEDGTKKDKAKKSVESLRIHTKGYIQISKEKEEAIKRRNISEQKILDRKTLEKDIENLKKAFFIIASNNNSQQRGLDLEKFLIDLFNLFELNPKGSIKNFGEQIDGAFTFDGTDYLLEAKWKKQVNRVDLASFQYKIESKLKQALGLLITIDGVTKEAISPEFKSIIIMDGQDLMAVLDGRVTLPDLLYKKRRVAVERGSIFVPYFELS